MRRDDIIRPRIRTLAPGVRPGLCPVPPPPPPAFHTREKHQPLGLIARRAPSPLPALRRPPAWRGAVPVHRRTGTGRVPVHRSTPTAGIAGQSDSPLRRPPAWRADACLNVRRAVGVCRRTGGRDATQDRIRLTPAVLTRAVGVCRRTGGRDATQDRIRLTPAVLTRRALSVNLVQSGGPRCGRESSQGAASRSARLSIINVRSNV